MTLAELETLSRLDLPVVVVVFNDSTLSLIAAKQSPEGHGGDDAVRYRDHRLRGHRPRRAACGPNRSPTSTPSTS